MTEPNEQKKEEGKEGFFSEWFEVVRNRFIRLPFIRRLKIGRKKASGQIRIFDELEKEGWLKLNQNLFGSSLHTIEKGWSQQGQLYGHGGDKEYLDGNPDGIINIYKQLGVYSDVNRIASEVNWFEHGTGLSGLDIKEWVSFEISDEKEWKQYNWDETVVRPFLNDPAEPWKINKFPQMSIDSGIVYHEGKSEFKEELYVIGHDNIKRLQETFKNFHDIYNQALRELTIPVEFRTNHTTLQAALKSIIEEFEKIEREQFTKLNDLSGIVNKYNELRRQLLITSGLRPETAGVGIVRFEHTYRIISQYITVEVTEEIQEMDERGRPKQLRKKKRYLPMYFDYIDPYKKEEDEIKASLSKLKDDMKADIEDRKEKIKVLKTLATDNKIINNELQKAIKANEDSLKIIIENGDDEEEKIQAINRALVHPNRVINEIIWELKIFTKKQIRDILKEKSTTSEKISKIYAAMLSWLKATTIIEYLLSAKESGIKGAFTPFHLDEAGKRVPKSLEEVYFDLQLALKYSELTDGIIEEIFKKNDDEIKDIIVLDADKVNYDDAYKKLKELVLRESVKYEDEIALIKIKIETETKELVEIEKPYKQKGIRLRRKLMEIANTINKDPIRNSLKPDLGSFKPRPEEKLGLGLDEHGYPLEIDPDNGEILIDRWWREIAQNKWQLEQIAGKPGGAELLKKHLDLDVDPLAEEGKRVPNNWKSLWKREQRVLKDTRFYGYVELMEMGSMVYSYWDSFRDDLRDGRYHPHSKSIFDYAIEGEGGFDPTKCAPYIRTWVPLVPSARWSYITRRGIIPRKEIHMPKSKQNIIKSTPDDFIDVPDDERAVIREYRMRMSDNEYFPKGSISNPKKWEKRSPSKYNPAFDRRAKDLDFVFWGNMYYWRWVAYSSEWSENPFPHISTRGLSHYLYYMAVSDVWNYADAEEALDNIMMDYGTRGQNAGFETPANPARGTGILQEN